MSCRALPVAGDAADATRWVARSRRSPVHDSCPAELPRRQAGGQDGEPGGTAGGDPIRWFHRIDLGRRIVTPGADDAPAKLVTIAMPRDLCFLSADKRNQSQELNLRVDPNSDVLGEIPDLLAIDEQQTRAGRECRESALALAPGIEARIVGH